VSDANRNVVWATAFVDELARQGVRHVCVAAGSRSAPLVFAFAADDRVRLHPFVDERSAGFFALGVGRAGGTPAAVVTTSGTAAANLLPAVVEASQGESALIVLTADRPAQLRGQDANQTIDQDRLYGTYPRAFYDVPLPEVRDDALRYVRALAARVVAGARDPIPGPVHVNLQFEEPLEPTPVAGDVPETFGDSAPLAARGRAGTEPFTRVRWGVPKLARQDLEWATTRIGKARRVLIVAGPSSSPAAAGPATLKLAAATGYPLLADPLSGARFARGAAERGVAAYDAFLTDPVVRARLAPDLVIRLGAAPTSAPLLRLLGACENHIVVDAGGRWKDHLAIADSYVRTAPAAWCAAIARRVEPAADPEWIGAWCRAGALAARALETEFDGEVFEGAVLAEAVRALPPEATLFVGNSLPIRDVDAFAVPRDDPLRVFGLRGASGIDGNVSTALGVSAVSTGPTLAALGDLAFYHDMNGLLAASKQRTDIVFFVINNDGGGIFHTLPIREYQDVLLPYVVQPHGLDFSHAAELYGLPFRRHTSPADARSALEQCFAAGGPHVLEVVSDREKNRRRREQVVEAVRDAVRVGLEE
jgi:2-succinyl-5-enolpyruvyl-6-hydroxy-3-cyclohexene-1-carboxylate synthase